MGSYPRLDLRIKCRFLHMYLTCKGLLIVAVKIAIGCLP